MKGALWAARLDVAASQHTHASLPPTLPVGPNRWLPVLEFTLRHPWIPGIYLSIQIIRTMGGMFLFWGIRYLAHLLERLEKKFLLFRGFGIQEGRYKAIRDRG